MPFFGRNALYIGERYNLNQKERLEEIHRKHEEIQQKRRIRNHRIILASAAAAALALLIVITAVSVTAISKHIEEKRAREAEIAAQATPSPEPKEIHIDPNVISEDYYANSAFIGNSFADDLYTYSLVPEADFFARTGLSVDDALEGDDEKKPVTDELDNGKSYDRIFMIFGENELGWVNPETFADDYGELIDKVRELCPESRVYLLSVTPVTKKSSDENINVTNNDRIREYNEIIKTLAEEKNAVYADVYSAVADKDGNLPVGAATDGVHFGKEYYEKCLLYIQNNYE